MSAPPEQSLSEYNYPLVSIIISNLNGIQVLEDCLTSLGRISYPNYEVVVVDAQSDDGSCEFIESRFPWVKLIKANRIGVGEAINIGIRVSNGKFIVFDFNNDEIAYPTWLSNLMEVIQQDEDIAIAGSTRIYNGSKNVIFDAGMKFDIFFHTHKRYHLKRLEKIPTKIADVDYVNIGVFRRKLIDEIGWFDEEYYFYGEDADLCLRAHQKGYRVVNVPWAVTSVKGSFTVGEGSAKQIYFSRRAGIRLIIKHRSVIPMVICIFERILLLYAEMILYLVGKIYGKRITGRSDVSAAFKAYVWSLKNIRYIFYAKQDAKRYLEVFNLYGKNKL